MKLRLLIFFLFSLNLTAVAQNRLNLSRQSGYYTYIYKLNDQDIHQLIANQHVLKNEVLHTLIDSFEYKKKYHKVLPKGNYLYMSVAKNMLFYSLNDQRNVDAEFVNNLAETQIYVKDLKGNLLDDAKVTLGNQKKLSFDPKTKLYRTSFPRKDGVMCVNYQGVTNYFEFELNDYNYREDWSFFRKAIYSFPLKYTWQPFKNIYRRIASPQKKNSAYKGYLVFSKPKYKPLDTVKFKAFLLQENGKPIKSKTLNVMLFDDYPYFEKKIATIKPYRDGAYEFAFALTDSLNLKLDNNYAIKLVDPSNPKQSISTYFNYEDYELKAVHFSARTDRSEHQLGKPITLYMKATDENDLAVPDGRVELTATTRSVQKYHGQQVFVPDTLFQKKMNLDPVGETKLVLPDSIFPKADLNFSLHISFLNSNNESRSDDKYLSYSYHDQQSREEIIASLQKDSIAFEYKKNDKATEQQATILTYSVNDELLDSITTKLPTALKTDFRVDNYEIRTVNGYKDFIFLSEFKPKINVLAMQTKDSLRVVVQNENKLPFWYTIFSGKQIFLKGYTSTLDTILRHTNNKAIQIRTSYYWDDEEVISEAMAYYDPQLLNLKLIAPDLVYPGQKVNMLVKVTDINNQPVPFTDLTAQAYTAKFGKMSTPNLPYFGKAYKIAKKKRKVEIDELYINGSIPLDWQRWGKSLGLDTIEYYKFTHPNDIYTIKEQLSDNSTQIAPFVMDKGNIDPIHVIYIDDIPVFYSKTNQLQRYAFIVAPGTHNLRFRTATKLVNIKGFEIEKGKKTILSVSSDLTNQKAEVVAADPSFSEEEANELNEYLITVTNTFDGKAIIELDSTKVLINPPSIALSSLLLGPFKQNFLRLETEEIKLNFRKEPNYTYIFLPGLLKQKSISRKYPFTVNLTKYPFDDSNIFKQYALREGEIDSIWEESLNLRSYTTPLFINIDNPQKESGDFRYNLDTAWSKNLPYVKNIVIYKPGELDFLIIHPGNQKEFKLNGGVYKVILLLKDNRYLSIENVNIKPFGENYFKWTQLPINKADQFSIKLDSNIKAIKNGTKEKLNGKVLDDFNDVKFDKKLLVNTMNGRVVDAKTKEPLFGVIVKLIGLSYSVLTNKEGEFELKVPKNGKAQISLLGFESVTVSVKNGDIGDVLLNESVHALNEVVVTGYGVSANKRALSYASASVVVNQEMLAGKVPGVALSIRGYSSIQAEKPLIILDGVVYSGDINNLDRASITDIVTLKGEEATALYGAKALNGVIIVKTKAGTTNIAAIQNESGFQSQTIRTKFSDVGFWKPKLITDENGSAAFTVQFPDDITKWNASIIAINGKKQKGFLETEIKSFKSLSANFVSPLFATAGDSINVIGKLMNYTPNEASAVRKFSYNGKLLKNGKVSFKNALIDTLAIKVSSKDSLTFEYTMNLENGYFDGEIRKIPVVAAGVKETKGYFSALLGDTTVSYMMDKDLGEVTVRSESSIFPSLLDEMTKLRTYEYLCNEQLASKLKGLLLEKKTRAYLNQQFMHEKDIKVILKKLLENKKAQQTWGWWKDSNEEIWISLHVVEALLQAEQQGYAIQLNKTALYNYLVDKLDTSTNYSQIHLLKLIHLLNEKYYLNDWIDQIERIKSVLKPTVFDRLELMELKQMVGLKINTDSLLSIKKQTMFGNMYWGEENNRFWDNSIQNTLLAYKILKKDGKNEAVLEKIRLYFLEQRKNGQWRNTYESSLILETILPDLMKTNQNSESASIKLNDELISKFPYEHKFTSTTLNVTKKGNMPVYFTAYQQFQNPAPEKMSKDFVVNTTFIQQGNPVAVLKAGKLATLKVEVEVKADADYVMIEIPIPAGCSYENKTQHFWGIETHREYFKEKTSIFCTSLKQGKYVFNIDLMPRYTGSYVLNPAKAEMMYFPVLFGRESMKKVGIN